MAMDRLSIILPNVLKQHGLQDQAIAQFRLSLARHWLSREFPQFHGLLQPRKIEKGVLFLETADVDAKEACLARSQELLAYLTKESRGADIQSVRVVEA